MLVLSSSSPREKLTDVDNGLCLPLKLLLNFSLFQYLVTTFLNRRQENRVRLLLGVAIMSFASLVPFALPGREMLSRNLNALSEVCSVLTFLLQIAILTRDVSKRLKIRQVVMLMWCAELLVVGSLSVLVVNVIDLFAPVIDMDLVELLDSIVQHVALVFIVGFRFYFLSMAKGMKKVLATQKAELVAYSLFLTHEIPFVVLHEVTPFDWHHVQGLWMRLTITMCLSLTIRARLSSHGSKKGKDTTGFYGPQRSQLDATDVHKPAPPIASTLTHSPVAIVPSPPHKTAWKK